MITARGQLPGVDWAVAASPISGETVSGDEYLACSLPNGVLLAVLDGLGHGAEAAHAASMARDVLQEHAGEKLPHLVALCHQEIRGSRGVVLTLAQIQHGNTMCWLGVGNVDGELLRITADGHRSRRSLVTRGGVVGSRLPGLRPETLEVAPGDTLFLFTDGIKSGFVESIAADESPEHLAKVVWTGWGRKTDDSLILVARFLRTAP